MECLCEDWYWGYLYLDEVVYKKFFIYYVKRGDLRFFMNMIKEYEEYYDFNF